MACKRPHAVRDATPALAADNLALIKGIGPKIAARLHDAGILTFAQLATFSSEDLATRVGGLSTRRINRGNWIKQARKLTQKAGSLRPNPGKTSNEIRQHYATFMIELLLAADNSVRRTRVTYIQKKIEETWAGWEEPRLEEFLVRCAELHEALPRPAQVWEVPVTPEQIPGVLSAEPIPKMKLSSKLSGVLRVRELETVWLHSDEPQYSAHANEPFHVRLVLDLTEVKPLPSVSLSYTVTIWARKPGTGSRQIVGEVQGTFVPVDQFPCIVEGRIRSQGTYHLEAMAAITSTSAVPSPQSTLRAWTEAGLFQIC